MTAMVLSDPPLAVGDSYSFARVLNRDFLGTSDVAEKDNERSMMLHAPIFEDTTSRLYHSNDGRLEVTTEQSDIGHVLVVIDVEEDEQLIASRSQEIIDAYIAGYDERERLNREEARS
jgi:hypothetical protein